MAGLVPAIHGFLDKVNQDVDARDKRGHDEWPFCAQYNMQKRNARRLGVPGYLISSPTRSTTVLGVA
jgi:hypothetical protein